MTTMTAEWANGKDILLKFELKVVVVFKTHELHSFSFSPLSFFDKAA